jgi:hypothetical protein
MPRVKCCSRKHSIEDNERRDDEVVLTERQVCKCSQVELRKRANAFTLRATGAFSMVPERGVEINAGRTGPKSLARSPA